MAEINIKSTKDERRVVARAIERLNEIQHVSYMSRNMLAETSGIKGTKVRVVLQDMIDNGEVTQYAVTTNPKLQRYYYVLTEAGKVLLESEEEGSNESV